jgi:peptidoglycan/xylan/chitin deacetylase (PgdA/CDA1 family)
VRGLLKTGIASVASLTRVDRLYATLAQCRRAAVLGYHRVVEDFDREASYAIPSLLISRAMLERHLDCVARRFQIVSLDELQSRLQSRPRTERPFTAITFDDGYRDVYEQAFPLLMRKGIPATVFVATDYVGTSGVLPHDKLFLLLSRASHRWRSFADTLVGVLRRLDITPVPNVSAAARSAYTALRTLVATLSEADVQRIIHALEVDGGLAGGIPSGFRLLTWDMVAEMSRAGIVIGSHTKTHTLLTNENPARVLEELSESRQTLSARLGRPAMSFAYPDGRFHPAAVRAVAAAGYQIAVTTCRHRDREHPWLTVPRVVLWERSTVDARQQFSPAIMSCQLSGFFQRHSHCRLDRATVSHASPYGERPHSANRSQRTVSLSGR